MQIAEWLWWNSTQSEYFVEAQWHARAVKVKQCQRLGERSLELLSPASYIVHPFIPRPTKYTPALSFSEPRG